MPDNDRSGAEGNAIWLFRLEVSFSLLRIVRVVKE